MITEALEAWILHKTWSGETSAQMVFFTKEKGLIRGLYKGARNLKKQAMLQSFAPLWLSLQSYSTHHYVHKLESTSPGLTLNGDALFSALYINELLYLTLKSEDPQPQLFEAYLITLNGLSNSESRSDLESCLRRFEWVLLEQSGYGITLNQEAKTYKPIEREKFYQFVPGLGLIAASTGFSGKDLLAISEDCLQDKSTLKTAKHLMRQAINNLLEGVEIKSRNLYTQAL